MSVADLTRRREVRLIGASTVPFAPFASRTSHLAVLELLFLRNVVTQNLHFEFDDQFLPPPERLDELAGEGRRDLVGADAHRPVGDKIAPSPDEVGGVIQAERRVAPRRHLDDLAPRGKPGREHRPIVAEQRFETGVEVGGTLVGSDADDAVSGLGQCLVFCHFKRRPMGSLDQRVSPCPHDIPRLHA